MTSTVVVGGFFGDEGKGKIISYLSVKDNPKIIVRGGAGPNAGHTIRDGDKTYKVRMLPSGFLNKNSKFSYFFYQYSKVITIFPRAGPSSRYRRASGTSLNR